MKPAFDADVIVVGAGSAGSVVAGTLARDPARRVLLIEAGPRDWNPLLRVPLMTGVLLRGRYANWFYHSEPEPGLNGRSLFWPRGKVVGGSSIINALAYQRGHAAAYDRWPAGWRHADLLPYFKRAETFSGGANAWRGGSGPLHVLSLADVTDRTPVAEAFMAAAQESGFPVTPDLGGEVTTGVGWNQLSIKGHRRDDAATAYLDSLEGSNGETPVDLLAGTQVLGLEIERGRCLGVRLAGSVVRPAGDVLLCAGAIDSPRLLMLSVIGPADELRALGIASAVDLPDVGRHLEDHLLLAGVAYQARRPVPASHYNHCDSLLYVPHATAGESPDILIMCLSVPFVRPTVGPLSAPAYVLVPCHLRPRSRGTVRLASRDPRAAAIIDPNYLGEPDDLAVLGEALLEQDEPMFGTPPVHGDDQLVDDWRTAVYPYRNLMRRKAYEKQKYRLQVELLKLQSWVKETGQRVVIVFEGRDAAGKGGTIKRFMEHLNPRGARVVALAKPTDIEQASGTSSATCSTFPPGARSCCSTAPGTTVPASSG